MALIVDKAWREDAQNLPHEEIQVPAMELPDPEPDNGNPLETLKEHDMKWTDLDLARITSNDSHAPSQGNH